MAVGPLYVSDLYDSPEYIASFPGSDGDSAVCAGVHHFCDGYQL